MHLKMDLLSKKHLHASHSIPTTYFCQSVDGSQFGGYWCTHVCVCIYIYIYIVPGTYLDITLLGGPENWYKGVHFFGTVG